MFFTCFLATFNELWTIYQNGCSMIESKDLVLFWLKEDGGKYATLYLKGRVHDPAVLACGPKKGFTRQQVAGYLMDLLVWVDGMPEE